MATSSNEEIVGEYIVIEDKQHKLGAGSYGTVYKAEHVSKKDNFAAAKKISGPKKRLEEEECEKEKDLLMNRIPPHENIIKVYDVVKKEYVHAGVTMVDIWLLMEYAPLGNLQEFAWEHELTVEEKVGLMLDCALGVQHLHNCKPEAIAHRDIKPENVVITGSVKNPTARLCDFGVGKAIGKNSDFSSVKMTTMTGTPAYAAPEQQNDKDGKVAYDKSVDIFSLGQTFGALFYPSPGEVPDPGKLDEIQNRPSDTPIHKAVDDIIQSMVQERAIDRIPIGNVVGGLRVCKSLASWFARPSSCDQGCQIGEPQTAAPPASDTPFPAPPPCALAVPLAAPPEGTLDLLKRQLAEHRVLGRLMGVIESYLICIYGTAHTSGLVTFTDERSKARMKTIQQGSGLTVENLPEQVHIIDPGASMSTLRKYEHKDTSEGGQTLPPSDDSSQQPLIRRPEHDDKVLQAASVNRIPPEAERSRSGSASSGDPGASMSTVRKYERKDTSKDGRTLLPRDAPSQQPLIRRPEHDDNNDKVLRAASVSRYPPDSERSRSGSASSGKSAGSLSAARMRGSTVASEDGPTLPPLEVPSYLPSGRRRLYVDSMEFLSPDPSSQEPWSRREPEHDDNDNDKEVPRRREEAKEDEKEAFCRGHEYMETLHIDINIMKYFSIASKMPVDTSLVRVDFRPLEGTQTGQVTLKSYNEASLDDQVTRLRAACDKLAGTIIKMKVTLEARGAVDRNIGFRFPDVHVDLQEDMLMVELIGPKQAVRKAEKEILRLSKQPVRSKPSRSSGGQVFKLSELFPWNRF